MKSLLALLALTTALTLPGLAMARPVTLTTTLNEYGGDGAYLALYVTDAAGAYKGSLWMAGRSLEITLDLADALFDAGYTLHVDAAVEDMRDSPNEVAVPLTTAGAGMPVKGRRYVASLTYGL